MNMGVFPPKVVSESLTKTRATPHIQIGYKDDRRPFWGRPLRRRLSNLQVKELGRTWAGEPSDLKNPHPQGGWRVGACFFFFWRVSIRSFLPPSQVMVLHGRQQENHHVGAFLGAYPFFGGFARTPTTKPPVWGVSFWRVPPFLDQF